MQLPSLPACSLAKQLAVPSDGSNLMQRDEHQRIANAFSACSTLRRVEPHATAVSRFAASRSHALQYPQTGRTSCNQTLLSLANFTSSSCSTLRRVEPHATRWGYRRSPLAPSLAVPSDGSNLMQPYE